MQDNDECSAQERVSQAVYGGSQYEGVECSTRGGDYRTACDWVCGGPLSVLGRGADELLGSLTCDYLGRKFAIVTTTAMIVVGGILATGEYHWPTHTLALVFGV